MSWLDGGEVSAVERDHDRGSDPLGKGDNAGVRASEREIGIDLDELRYPIEIVGGGTFDVKGTKAAKESRLGASSEPAAYEIGRLGYH